MRGVFCPSDSHHVRRHLENPLNFRPLFFRIEKMMRKYPREICGETASQNKVPSRSGLVFAITTRLILPGANNGAPGLENAIAAVWDGVLVQRCTVHKHRNLLAHAPERLHEEISADYNAMIYAATREEIERQRKAFIRKWRLKHHPVGSRR
jgi:hypothetical protein